MRACCDRGISRVVRCSGLTGGATSLLRTGGGAQDRQHARFPRGLLGRRRGVRDRWLGGLPFRREERLSRLARIAIRSRLSPRAWWCCSRWLSKSCPDCLAARESKVEFVSFCNLLPKMLGARSTSEVAKRSKIGSRHAICIVVLNPGNEVVLCLRRSKHSNCNTRRLQQKGP
jgi:hypothetical protein